MRFSGIVVPPFTIFNADRTVNVAGQELLTKHVILNGADVLFLCGSTGEGQYVQRERPDQRDVIIDATIQAMKATGQRRPVIMGIYGETVDEVLNHLNQVQDSHAGDVDGIVLAPPLATRLQDHAMLAHFTRLLDRSDLPTFLYNNPATFGGNVIPVGLYRQCLDDHHHLAGIKDSSKDMAYKASIMDLLSTRKEACYYEGGEGAFHACLDMAPPLLAGRVGCVPSIGNVLNLPARIRKAFEGGDKDGALHLQQVLDGIRNRIYHEPKTSGKAQRGGKQALSVLYPGTALDIPVVVQPSFERAMDDEAKASIKAAVDEAKAGGHVETVPGA